MVAVLKSSIALLMLLLSVTLQPELVLAGSGSPLEVSVSPRSGTKGEVYSFHVVVDGAGVSKPRLSESSDFEIHFVGPKVSINISPQGRSFTTEYLYTLFPKRTGTLRTPNVELEDQGQTYTADGIEVEVREGETKGQSDEVTVQQKVTPESAYVGQQISYQVEILTRTQLAEGKLDDLTIDNIWQEPLGEEEHGRRKISGTWYDAYINRKALFATKAGTYTVPGRTFDAKALRTSQGSNPFGMNDPFGTGNQLFQDFFAVQEFVPMTLKSEPLQFTVKELPPLPPGFPTNGLHRVIVGETTLKIKIGDGPLKAGESKTVTVEVTSVGNLAPLSTLAFSSNKHYKIYDEPAKTQNFENNEQLVTRKTFTFSVIPLHAGSMTLPDIAIGYFDPVQGEYKIAKGNTIKLEVGEGSASTIAALSEKEETPKVNAKETKSAAKQHDSELLTPSPTPTPVAQQLYKQRDLPLSYTTLLYYLLGSLALIGTLVSLFAWKQRKAPLEKLLKQLEGVSSLSELGGIIKTYFALLIGPDVGALSLQQLKRSSYSAKLPATAQLSLGQILDQLEEYSFSGRPCTAEQLSTLKHDIKQVIKRTPLRALFR